MQQEKNTPRSTEGQQGAIVCIEEHCFSDQDISQIWNAQPQHVKDIFSGDLRQKQWLKRWVDRELLALEAYHSNKHYTGLRTH